MNDDSFETDLRVVLSEGSGGDVPERLRASVARAPERVGSRRLGSWRVFRGPAAAIAAVTSAIVVVAIIFGAIFLRSNGTTAGRTEPPPASARPIGIGIVNATGLRLSLVVNGTVIETLAPHAVDKAIGMNALPPLPWVVEVRMSSGRVLATMTVPLVGDGTQPGSWAAGADLSCGQLYLWTGAQEPIWPAPGSGSPGDCLP